MPPRRLAVVILLLPAAFFGGIRPAGADWQNFRSTNGGLAGDQVLAITEASDGAIWFGTNHGASRFDGAGWRTIVDSLPHPVVNSVLQDRRGAFWFATQQGLASFDGAHWSRWNSTLPSVNVFDILEDHRGDLWFGTANGIARFEPGLNRWTNYLPGAGGLVAPAAWELFEDRQHRLWIGTQKGASALDSTRTVWTSYTADPNALGRDSVLALGEDKDGGIWFGTDLGAWRLSAVGQWTHYTDADGLPGNVITAFARDSLGVLWIGATPCVPTVNGCPPIEFGVGRFARFDGQTFFADGSMPGSKIMTPIFDIQIDRSGNAWFATAADGAFRFDRVAWRNFFASPGDPCVATPTTAVPSAVVLGSNCVTAMLQDASGDLWFGTYFGGISRLSRASAWSQIKFNTAADWIQAAVEDRSQFLWFGSLGLGIGRLDPTRTRWVQFTRTNGLAADTVRCAFVDAAGIVWAGTTNGASRWNGVSWSSVLRGGIGGSPVEVQQILEDADHNLWMRTTVGLYRLDPTRTVVTKWGIAEGLTDDYVTCMLRASGGAMWFGTGQGLNRLQQGVWTTWTTIGSLGEGTVNALFEDHLGRIWVGANFGAARLEGGVWETFTSIQIGSAPITGVFEDSRQAVWLATPGGLAATNGDVWRIYGSGNGPAANAITGFLEDSQHRLWFMSDGGLTEHEPDRVSPQTLLTRRPDAVSGSRDLHFSFAAAYGEIADLGYSYGWDGTESGWSPDGDFNPRGVPDGLYTFSVKARDWIHNEDPTLAVYTFEVDGTPPTAVIESPVFGQPVRGTVAVVGSTADARFKVAGLLAKPAAAPWDSAVVLGTSIPPVNGETLALWNTTSLADGDWNVKLTVTDTLGLIGTSLVKVIVDNQAPYANVTTPAKIIALDGGDVFTTNVEVHLYFPPHAFDQDATVTIDPNSSPAIPDTLPNGAIRRSDAWDIGWTGAQLVKDGTLEMRPTPVTPPGPTVAAVTTGGTLAIYAEAPGGWRRLGGSPTDGGGRGLAIAGPGRYALFEDHGAPATGNGLSGITLAPRVFSPHGSFGAQQAAIGFSLGASGTATVKIFNRAGRLIRTVADHMSAGPGANLVHWDGRDRDGAIVSAGLYLVTVEALGDTKTQTLAVVR